MLDRSRCRDHRGHHPWRFIGQFPEWTVEWRNDLEPQERGLTIFAEKKILMADDQGQAERRGTICHEGTHVVRGPFTAQRQMYEEALADRQASRLLMPSVRRIGHALAWFRADYESAADHLWVDEHLLNVRLSTLAPRERAWLVDQMDSILVD